MHLQSKKMQLDPSMMPKSLVDSFVSDWNNLSSKIINGKFESMEGPELQPVRLRNFSYASFEFIPIIFQYMCRYYSLQKGVKLLLTL